MKLKSSFDDISIEMNRSGWKFLFQPINVPHLIPSVSIPFRLACSFCNCTKQGGASANPSGRLNVICTLYTRPLPDRGYLVPTPKAKHRQDTTRGNQDEIHHQTGDVLLMVTVGDPSWAGCAMRSHRCMWASFTGPPPLSLLLLHLYLLPFLSFSFSYNIFLADLHLGIIMFIHSECLNFSEISQFYKRYVFGIIIFNISKV